MENYLSLSYALALILTVLCILIFSSTFNKKGRLGVILISIFGIYTGLGGVLWSVSFLFRDEENPQVFGLMSAWLLLEAGAVQLSQVMKKLNKAEVITHRSSQGRE
jgi:hypothetical protein